MRARAPTPARAVWPPADQPEPSGGTADSAGELPAWAGSLTMPPTAPGGVGVAVGVGGSGGVAVGVGVAVPVGVAVAVGVSVDALVAVGVLVGV